MNIHNIRQRVADTLNHTAGNYRKLFFLYGAASLGISLLIAILDTVLAGMIAETGGLAGIQTRAVLSTAQTLLQVINTVALPFWMFGLVFCTLQLARGKSADCKGLLEGFCRFGPVLRLMLTKVLLLLAVCMACSYVAAVLFALTPMSAQFMQTIGATLDVTDAAAVEAFLTSENLLEQLLPVMKGYFMIYAVLLGVICIPLGLRMSMTDFVVMDQEKMGGFRAVRESFRLTKGNCLKLLGLGFGFWWYYVLSALAIVLMNLDAILLWAEIPLPVSAQVAYWVFYGVYIVAQLALLTLAAPRVQTTYAAAYMTMKEEKEVKEEITEE